MGIDSITYSLAYPVLNVNTPSPAMNEPEQPKENDSYLDQTLRPSTFDDYIGQESIKENLKILLGFNWPGSGTNRESVKGAEKPKIYYAVN